jgi:ABC-type polar amino acid transport system ATPase subunit
MIRITSLRKRRGDRLALDGVDLHIAPREAVAILGPSGSGKTTLLRCLNGLEPFEGGKIEIAGFTLGPDGEGRAAKNLVRLRRSVGLVFQDFQLFSHLSVLDNVALAPNVTGGQTVATARRDALELLTRVGLADRASALPHQLSGGQKQRVAIVRALALRPSVLLLDEPTSALDRTTAEGVAQTILELTRGSVTLVLVTHQHELAKRMADRILHLEHGVLSEPPSPEAPRP